MQKTFIIILIFFIIMHFGIYASFPFSGNAVCEAHRQKVYDDVCEQRLRASYIKSIKRFLSADLSLNLSQEEARILITDLSAAQKVADELSLTKRQVHSLEQTLEVNNQTCFDLQEQVESKNQEIIAIQRASTKLSSEFSTLLLMKEKELAQVKLHKVTLEKALKQIKLENNNMRAINHNIQNGALQLQSKLLKAEQDRNLYRRVVAVCGIGFLLTSAIAVKLYFDKKK